MSHIGVLGAGTWGMALARMLCNSGHSVTVWSPHPASVDYLASTRQHRNLPGMVIPDAIAFTKDLSAACVDQDILLFAVPSVYVRETARQAAPYVTAGQILVDAAKGMESETLMTMSEVIRDELSKRGIPCAEAGAGARAENRAEAESSTGTGNCTGAGSSTGAGKSTGAGSSTGTENVAGVTVPVVALSGPTHAEEVALDLPATIVSACADLTAAETVQTVFMNTCMRVYTNSDVKGVELCGALKNIIALACGISTGLGCGDNARAALITRGLAEMDRLGEKMGCRRETFAGLAGMGDVVVTATSTHSRNNRCGTLIGQGVPPAEAVAQVGMVVEGVNAVPAAIKLADRYGVDMPIVRAVDAILNHGADPSDEVRGLMTRAKTTEMPV